MLQSCCCWWRKNCCSECVKWIKFAIFSTPFQNGCRWQFEHKLWWMEGFPIIGAIIGHTRLIKILAAFYCKYIHVYHMSLALVILSSIKEYSTRNAIIRVHWLWKRPMRVWHSALNFVAAHTERLLLAIDMHSNGIFLLLAFGFRICDGKFRNSPQPRVLYSLRDWPKKKSIDFAYYVFPQSIDFLFAVYRLNNCWMVFHKNICNCVCCSKIFAQALITDLLQTILNKRCSQPCLSRVYTNNLCINIAIIVFIEHMYRSSLSHNDALIHMGIFENKIQTDNEQWMNRKMK